MRLTDIVNNIGIIKDFINKEKNLYNQSIINIQTYLDNNINRDVLIDGVLSLFYKSRNFRDLFEYSNDLSNNIAKICSNSKTSNYYQLRQKLLKENLFIPKEQNEILINIIEDNSIKQTIAYLIEYDFNDGNVNAIVELNSEDYDIDNLIVNYNDGFYTHTDSYLEFDENYPTIIKYLNTWLNSLSDNKIFF